MQKKSLVLLMVLSCLIVHAENTEYSVFSSMPEEVKNQIPATLREEIDARWKKEQADKLAQEIDEYYGGDEILLKEFEKPGSIDEALKVKEASNAQTLANRKYEVCRCSRHRWPWQYYMPESEVEKSDKVFENQVQNVNLRYKEAATKHKEKFIIIRQEVTDAYSQYKRKIKALKRINKSVQQCHNDLHCHEDNDIFDRHLSSERREAIIKKVFDNALKSCQEKKIADKDILTQIWEKDPLLIKYQEDAKKYNNLIDIGLNPELQEEQQQEQENTQV